MWDCFGTVFLYLFGLMNSVLDHSGGVLLPFPLDGLDVEWASNGFWVIIILSEREIRPANLAYSLNKV